VAGLDVTNLQSALTFSVRRLADEFSLARETISRRLAEANVVPAGNRNGHPVYRLNVAAAAILRPSALGDDGQTDPRKLPPQERNAWFASELRRLETELKTGQLVPAAELESSLADNAKTLVQFLETLPDQLERDANLLPEQIEAMHASIDRARQGLYDRLLENEPEQTTAQSESGGKT